ncbi:TPA: hypothetical protein ACYTL8_004149 [Escherichia coli]
MSESKAFVNAKNMIESATTVDEICQAIMRALRRVQATYGVSKRAGVSIERERKMANAAAIELLNQLPEDSVLTDEQRQILARYTGEGGIGANEHEYYTPQYVAEGMWDLMQLYGSPSGNWLEPAAGTGVFHETKPAGAIMTATEISPISSKINRLLHPEDKVSTSAFERLAAASDDGIFDGVVGNVPFGDNRGTFANMDPAYAQERNIGRYFILRLLDKVKPGGYVCIIVPYGMTSGSTHKRLRLQVSRKAEFLGAHRLPSGTFEENGTATAVDVWVLRKHPEELAQRIIGEEESLLKNAMVLWDTYINGKWFEQDGKRFVHGEVLEGYRMTVKNDTITSGEIKTKLLHKFHSRIDWEMLGITEPAFDSAVDGDRRLINDRWHIFTDDRWVLDNSIPKQDLDVSTYGAGSYAELRNLFNDTNPAAVMNLSWDQIESVYSKFPELVPATHKTAITFAASQPAELRERVFRGSIIGSRISVMQDWMATGELECNINDLRQDIARMVSAEYEKHGHPGKGKAGRVRGKQAADWLKFKTAITEDGTLSSLIAGTLDTTPVQAFNSSDAAQVVSHLFSQIDLVPIDLNEFREAFTGEAPESDDELLAMLSVNESIAITADGHIMPMDRATSGDISALTATLMTAIGLETNEAVKQNYLRQLEEVKRKRKWTEVDSIDFNINARWFDRSLVLEFLREQGYTELQYLRDIQVENGALISEQGYRGSDGVFAGYRYGTVVSKNKETGQMESVYKRVSKKDPFLAQLEGYLNGNKPRGVFANQYMEQIRDLEERFNTWIRQHDEIGDLVQQYNDAFNAYIPFEQSDASLELKGISGKTVPFGYQNSEIRRLSEDGKGICGFGTGLGKTTVGLGLEAFNYENGRSKRTATVVPKSVYDKLYQEAKDFYDEAAFSNMLFVGLDIIRNEDGTIKQVPVLDANGQPKVNSRTGEVMYRDAVAESSSDTIKERMNAIPQSNWRHVFMTKEQYARIPMREESIRDHAQDILHANAEAGRVNLDGTKHRDANKKSRLLDEASDTGTRKEQEYPYFEDMNFDNVIVDEGHNYRNSYSAGRESARLAFLPTGAVAQSARDMAVKNAYLMAKNNGRGCVMLTATPLVNSPIDAFNMLSHVVEMKEWQRMGIFTPDDFVRVFGQIAPVTVQKLSGKAEVKDGLVGFKNLDGLRGIFHRWTVMKTAQDVSSDVKIPDLDEKSVEVPLSDEQMEIYETLRARADAISNAHSGIGIILNGNNDTPLLDAQGNEINPEEDSTFSVIRDMDRVTTDLDLYRRQMTFNFPVSYKEGLEALVNDLPNCVQVVEDEDGEEEEVAVPVETSITVKGKVVQLVVPESYEEEVLARLEKFGIARKDLSHPVPPKYSALIENLKKGMKDGKQIIFSDEKSQHGKLRRIIAAGLGIDESEIGILNATTVANAGKKGKKPKRVKAPAEPKEDASPEQLDKYYQQKAAYDAYVAAQNEVSLSGLESIAADYNEGRTRIIICNKKAEVGINLHLGTADIHHLTLPWTPGSIKQRNGRGARVGSTQDKVRVHYYCGKDSFDDFRLTALQSKKDWINKLLTSNESRMENADANDAVEMKLMLAKDPEERARRNAEQVAIAQEKVRVAAKKRADIDLKNFLKAQHSVNCDTTKENEILEQFRLKLSNAQDSVNESQAAFAKAQQKLATLIEEDAEGYLISSAEYTLKRARESLFNAKAVAAEANSKFVKQERKVKRLDNAANEAKRLRPAIEAAINKGLLGVGIDIIDRGDNYLVSQKTGNAFKVGETFHIDTYTSSPDKNALARIVSFDFDAQTARLEQVYSTSNNIQRIGSSSTFTIDNLPPAVSVTEDDISIRKWIMGGVSMQHVADRLAKNDFHQLIREGALTFTDSAVPVFDNERFELLKGVPGYMGRSDGVKGPDLLKRADKVVYPDATDGILKTRVAAWFRGNPDYLLFLHEFAIALYGRDYKKRINEFGNTASVVDIDTWLAEYIPDYIQMNDKYLTGERRSQITNYLNTGQLPDIGVNEIIEDFCRDIPSNYTNRDDFIPAIRREANRLQEQANINCKNAARAQAVNRLEMFQSEVKGLDKYGLDRIERLVKHKPQLGMIYGALHTGTDFYVFFADAVNIGLIDERAITVELLADYEEQKHYAYELLEQIWALTDQGKGEDLLNHAREKAGQTTAEDRAEAASKKQAVIADETTAEVANETSGIVVKKNATAILSRWKGRVSYKFGVGECYGLHDPFGKRGNLFKAKDDLKTRFNAKYYNGDKSGEEFEGAWWLVSTQHDLQQVLSVINSAA